jgi:hypothetical protein
MPTNRQSSQNISKPIINFLLWTILFAMAYSQSPLFTSNQNQYFLHGLAHAGVGYLNQDWLVHTADPTPVFSSLVEYTHRLLHWEPVFYGYYALLMGIYIFSLFGIARLLFAVDKSNVHALFFLAMFFLIHSAGLRFVFSRLIGVNWTYILEDGVADQRMLGPVFQPSAFGVLLVLSIYLFLNHRPYPAIITACLAAIVHPTYLLSAACLTLVYMLITYREIRHVKIPLAFGILALVLVSPVLFQTFSVFGGTDPAITEKSRQILINFRIPHHALVSQWFDATAVVKILIILFALVVLRKKRLFMVVLLPFVFAALLTLIQIFTQNSALALVFPWRVSIFLVPVSVTILIAHFGNRLIDWLASRRKNSGRWQIVACLLLILLAVTSGASRFTLDLIRKTNIPENELFSYVSAHKQPADLYLIPSKMQDFRLATGAPVFTEFKSPPYKDTDVLEWYRRILLNNRFYQDMECTLLSSLIENDGITHIVIESNAQFNGCASSSIQYQDANFQIYRVNP